MRPFSAVGPQRHEATSRPWADLPTAPVGVTSISAARTTPHGLQPFPCNERDHPQPSEWISPPPSPPSVETEAHQEDRRQVRAYPRLKSLRLQSPARELSGDSALVADKQRHHDQRQRGNDDAHN